MADENNETDDGEDSDENSGTGQSFSVGIMFALSWLMIYNIWIRLDNLIFESDNYKVNIWFKKLTNKK